MGISDWLEEATPDRREVTVCFDRRLMSDLVAAKDRLKAVREEGMLGDTGDAEDVERLEGEVREKSRTLVFEGMGWGRWRDLISKHAPAPDQQETFNRAVELGFMPHAVENIGYNAETFVPAAIAASCTDPGISLEEARALLYKGPPGVIERVWSATLEVNLSGGNDPFVSAAAAPITKKSRRLSR